MTNRKADRCYMTLAIKVLQAHSPSSLLKTKQKFDKTNAQNINLSHHSEVSQD